MTKPNAYLTRINLVTDHISAHLHEELALTGLAQIAGFSPFHFHRLFKSVTGETLNDFVVRRRLERAVAVMKAAHRRSLTQIAIECGFNELSDFSRAFKRHFGQAPSNWDRRRPLRASKIRQAPHALPAYTADALARLDQDPAFAVTIRMQPAQQLAYIRIADAYSQPEKIMHAYDTLNAWVDARGRRGRLYGMSEDDPDVTPPALYRYDVCMAVSDTIRPDDVVSTRTLPAHRLASLHCVGNIVQVDLAWQYLYRHWLPHSGFLPDNLPAMEIYVRTPADIGWETFDLECAIAVVPL